MNQPTTQTAARERFDRVLELVADQEFAAADALCQELLQQDPADVNILGLRGAVLIKLNRLDEAETVLRRALRLAPTFAKPHEDLGIALLDKGDAAGAAEVLENAVRLDPSLELAWFNLGKARARLGRGAEADAAFEKSFELNPERKLTAHAAELHRDGRFEEAERMYREVIRANPRNVDALRMLGRIALSMKRNSDAERLFRRTVSIAPDFVGAWLDLGRVLKDTDSHEEAMACYRRVIELQPDNPKGHFMLAGVLAPAGRTYEAIESYRRALDLEPDYVGALLGLGHVLKTVGRLDEAIDAYRECIRCRPDNGGSYWSLANLKTYRLSDEDIETMQSILGSEELGDTSRVNFLFALAKAFEDRGDFERAWDYYATGNASQRVHEYYDPVQTESINDAIVDVFDATFLSEKAGGGDPDHAPIFVVGLPRSGSTLIEQILASHSAVEGTSELPYVGRVAASLNRNRADGINYPRAVRELSATNFAELGREYLRRAGRHRVEGTRRFIDKMPNNFPLIGFLHMILPNAKIIDARRHPLDSCLSCYRQLFARGQSFTYDLTDIGEYFLQYQRLMDHWHAVLPGRVLTVQYEQLVGDFENQTRSLLEYCGLPFEDACLKFYETDRPVRTPSSEQVRRPIYTSSIGFWRNYEGHLGELREVLAPCLERYERYL
jgi:tetratricopeptide (TPR) repeat protein